MTDGYHIRYLKRQDIDSTAWDDCIHASPAGLIYAKSFFLDTVSGGQWDALVMGDYQAVMPLIWNKKYGFTYLYQPSFVPALGVFCRQPQSPSLSDFLAEIPTHFRFWDIDCNETNILSPSSQIKITTTRRKNFFLSLDRSGPEIRGGYRRLARRMIQKALDLPIQIVRDADPDEVIEYFRLQYDRALGHIAGEVYERTAAAARLAKADGRLSTYLARHTDGQVLAFYLLLQDEKFVYSVLGGSTDRGKDYGAFYLLTDAAIQDHCNSRRIFRFEGSDVPGIAFFNTQFGSYPVHYSHLIVNKLPFPVNLFKKK